MAIKSDMKNELNNQWSDTLKQITKLDKKISNTISVAAQSSQISESNTKRINVIENLQDDISRFCTKNENNIKELYTSKLDSLIFDDEISIFHNKFKSHEF